MGAPVVIIVTGVVVTVGVAALVTQHVWPHVKPEVEDFFRRLSETRQRRRQREQPYAEIPGDGRGPRDAGGSSSDFGGSTVVPESHQRSSFRDEATAPISSSVTQHRTTNNIRLRSAAGSPAMTTIDQRLLDVDVEMVQMNQSKPSLYTPMTPTSSTGRPASRGAEAEDRTPNPFLAEGELPIPSAIPLPVSPAASLTVEDTKTSPMVSSGVLSPGSINLGTPLQQAAALSPEPLQQHSRMSTSTSRPSYARHQTSNSQSSMNAFMPSPSLGPKPSPSARSPVVRAASPSDNMSDSVMSMVSAAPSRGWTDGGTADIFSGSERDFNGPESDDDDVRSVSDSGSWEELSNAAGASAAASSTGRTR